MKKNFMFYLESMRNVRYNNHLGDDATVNVKKPVFDVTVEIDDSNNPLRLNTDINKYIEEMVENHNGEVTGSGAGMHFRDITCEFLNRKDAIRFIKEITSTMKNILNISIYLYDNFNGKYEVVGAINKEKNIDSFIDFMAGKIAEWEDGVKY